MGAVAGLRKGHSHPVVRTDVIEGRGWVVEMLLVSAIGIRNCVVCELKVPELCFIFQRLFFVCAGIDRR